MSATNSCGKADVRTALDVSRSAFSCILDTPVMTARQIANPFYCATIPSPQQVRILISALLLGPGKRSNVPEPLLLRAAPDLPLRHELIALAHGADADVVDL